MRTSFSVLFFLFLTGCNQKRGDCDPQTVSYANKTFVMEGCYKDGKETGHWTVRLDGKVLEYGEFKSGFRAGNWKYPLNNADTAIFWGKRSVRDLEFNIPSQLSLEDSAEGFVKFSSKDTVYKFSIGIDLHDLPTEVDKVENYHKIGEQEVTGRGWKFKNNHTTLAGKRQTAFVNAYDIETPGGDFKMLNFYTLVSGRQIVEVTCRYHKDIEATSRTIFYSVIPNLFKNGKRVINFSDM